jgi:hypothetical protein
VSGQRGKPFDNIFAGKSFVDAVSLITTGRTGWVSPSGPTPTSEGTIGIKEGPGVGDFRPGTVIQYGPKGNDKIAPGADTSLERWDQLCLFGTDSAGTIRGFLTEKQCRDIGKNSFWQRAYSPLSGRVHFLLPAGGLQISDMIRSATEGMNNISGSPDWQDRQSLVTTICNTLDYEWSVTGAGDIIFEFPMYDFLPSDFGQHAALYVVNGHIQDDNLSEEEGDIPAGLEATSLSSQLAERLRQETLDKASPAVPVPRFRAVSMSNVLASKYGAKVQHVTFTGVSTLTALKKLTLIEHQKRIARTNRMSFNMSYRPWLRPNRPLLHETRNRIGKLSSVSISLPLYTQPPTTRVAIDCVRLPLLKKQNGKTVITYRHILEGDSMPLSYNAFFEPPDKIGNPDQGLTIRGPDNS